MDAEASDAKRTETFAKSKRRRLIGMLTLSAAVGVVVQLSPEIRRDPGLFAFCGGLLYLMLIVSWCLLDARDRGYRIRQPLLVTIVCLAFIGVPIYLIRTRGIRGVWSSTLAVIFFCILIAIEYLASEIMFYLM